MPWREVSVMAERREFVRLALQEGANRRELCCRFGISPDVAYKWLERWRLGDRELADRSRRPHNSPGKTSAEVETAVLAVRDAHPAWGARKIASCLKREGTQPPAISTICEILRREGRIRLDPAAPREASRRFEMSEPNQLWQMDFKGWVPMSNGVRCHPLTVIDDHSRFVPCLKACDNQQGPTVRGHLETAFRVYGLPDGMFVDNGNPWGDPRGERWTRFEVWLLKLGIRLLHSRPYHPQGRGKNERFHRTLVAEVFDFHRFASLDQAQQAFDHWREVYNFERPHEALGQHPPASRYRPSHRSMPERLPQVQYDSGETVRTVSSTKALHQLQGPALACAHSLLRRAPGRPAPQHRWSLRRLLRQPPHRRHRLDRPTTCQPCPRTGVSYLPGLNNKAEDDGKKEGPAACAS